MLFQELSLHYTVHTSLDVVEEKLASSVTGAKAGPADTRELYLGSLHVSEHQKVTIQRLCVPSLTNQRPQGLCLPSILNKSNQRPNSLY